MEKQTVPDENDSKRREDLKLLEKLRAITEKGDSALVKMNRAVSELALTKDQSGSTDCLRVGSLPALIFL